MENTRKLQQEKKLRMFTRTPIASIERGKIDDGMHQRTWLFLLLTFALIGAENDPEKSAGDWPK